MNYRMKLIKFITFLGGLYFFLKFVLPKKFSLWGVEGSIEFGRYHEQIALGITAMIVMSVGLGIGNLIFRNTSTILYRRKGAINSFMLLFGLFAMLGLSAVQWRGALVASKKAEALFTLKEFAERIQTDARGETTIVVAVDRPLPSVEERTRALKAAAQSELASVRAETESLKLASEAGNRAIADLQTLITTAERKLQLIPDHPGVEGNWDFEGHTELSRSLVETGAKLAEVLAFAGKETLGQKAYDLLFSGIFVALGSAMFSLLGFYIASAAYRAFRIRSLESGLMMGAALFVILGQIPFMLLGNNEVGIWFHEVLPKVRLWLLTVPNSAAFRAIEIGVAVGALVQAFRMWLSIESGSFSKASEKKE